MSAQPGFLDLQLNGIGANFNLGPSTADAATAAYGFVNNSSAMDTAFLGSSIAGSQRFLSSQISPVLAYIGKQGNVVAGLLPSMFSNIGASNNQVVGLINSTVSAGLSAGSQVANASIASSTNSSGGGSLCFITTAVCESRGLPDNCEELEVLRCFRDTYMLARSEYRPLVAQYYRVAPKIVDGINSLPFAGAVYDYLYDKYIAVCLFLIAHGQRRAAIVVYSDMVEFASKFAER